jgi:hypothetical protein
MRIHSIASLGYDTKVRLHRADHPRYKGEALTEKGMGLALFRIEVQYIRKRLL